jgi:hypothetical protein
MCEKCVEINKRLYPDLGEGAELHVREIKDTLFNAPHSMDGIRFVQDRVVDYLGPEGVETRNELHAIYIPWTDLLELLLELGQCYTNECPQVVKMADAVRMHIQGWFGENES